MMEAVAECRNCNHEYIATPGNVDCPKCGFNFYWVDESTEKYSGPKFKNGPVETVSKE